MSASADVRYVVAGKAAEALVEQDLHDARADAVGSSPCAGTAPAAVLRNSLSYSKWLIHAMGNLAAAAAIVAGRLQLAVSGLMLGVSGQGCMRDKHSLDEELYFALRIAALVCSRLQFGDERCSQAWPEPMPLKLYVSMQVLSSMSR